MAEGSQAHTQEPTSTQTITEEEGGSQSPTLRLRLHKPKPDKKVKWTSETVDNEHMGKKKSKCCCIYEKPKLFGESSSSEEDDDDCTDHCRGHKKKCYHSEPHSHGKENGNGNDPAGASEGT